MKRGKQDLANLIVFGAALAVVVIGITMSFMHAHGPSPAAQARRPQAPPQPPRPQVRGSQGSAAPRPQAAPDVVAPHAIAAPKKPAAEVPGSHAAPRGTASPPASASPPQRRFAPRQYAAGRGPVPPLLPPLYGPQMASVAARPPDVLRLTGIVEGQARLAIMRRGGNRYMVRLGDSVDGQRVLLISAGSVVLQHGAHKRTLRLSK